MTKAAMKTNFSPLGDQITLETLAHDPYPLFQEMLAHTPVCWAPAFHLWMITRREDVIAILRDAETFTMEPTSARANPMEDIFGPMLLSLDGVEHQQIRDLFAEPFRARQVRTQYQPLIEQLAHRLVDEFTQPGNRSKAEETVDLDKAFSDKLAIYTIVTALGLDVAEVEPFRLWYDDFAAALGNLTNDPHIRQAGKSAFAQFEALVLAQVKAFQRTPNQSVLSYIVHNNQHNLSDAQLVANMALTFFGAVETTSAMLSNTIWALLSHPEQCAQVRQNPSLIQAALAESLRWEAPVQAAMRFPRRDVVIHDVTIKQGEKIYCMLGAANRDPAFFPQPDRFDLQRPNANKHLSFAYGPHYCLGAPLALLEGEIGLSILLQRLPNLRLHPAYPTAPYGHEFRATPTLYVEW